MRGQIERLISRAFFPALLVSVVVLIAVVYSLAGQETAARGSYVLFGVTLAALVYYAGTEIDAQETDETDPLWHLKLLLVVGSIGFVLAAIFDRQAVIFTVVLPIGYGLLFVHIRTCTPTIRSVGGAMTLFALTAFTKYATTGFYFSSGDTLLTVRYVRQVVDTGMTSSIRGLYQFFPGIHLLSGSFSLLTGVDPYDSLFVMGIFTYTLMLPLTYLLVTYVSGDRTYGVSAAVALSLLEPIQKYAAYFFPEAFALPLFVLAIYIAVRSETLGARRSWILSFFFVAAAVVTHHLSVVLVVPMLIWLGVSSSFNSAEYMPSRRLFETLALVGIVTALHWVFSGWAWWFFVALSRHLIEIGSLLSFSSGGGGGQSVFVFGDVAIRSQTLGKLLMYPPFVYLSLLMTLVVLGISTWLRDLGTRARYLSFFVGGILSVPLLLELPVAIPSVNRIRLPYAFLFAFVVGAGIREFTRREIPVFGGNIFLILLILLFAVSGTMANATNMVNPSDITYQQTGFTEAEHQQLTAASDIIMGHEGQTSALWITSVAFESRHIQTNRNVTITQQGIRPPGGLFVYRTKWTDHAVLDFQQGRSRKLLLSDEYLTLIVSQENKVYDAGSVGMTWQRETGYLGS